MCLSFKVLCVNRPLSKPEIDSVKNVLRVAGVKINCLICWEQKGVCEGDSLHSEKKMIINWKTNYQLEAQNEKGISVKFDAPISHDGEETALSPMENVLASLAACSSFHVLSILKKMKQDVKGYTVEATAERRETPPPRVFTKIHLNYIVKGPNIESNAVKKAVTLSEEKYCSVGGMLKKAVEITSSYEVLNE